MGLNSVPGDEPGRNLQPDSEFSKILGQLLIERFQRLVLEEHSFKVVAILAKLELEVVDGLAFLETDLCGFLVVAVNFVLEDENFVFLLLQQDLALLILKLEVFQILLKLEDEFFVIFYLRADLVFELFLFDFEPLDIFVRCIELFVEDILQIFHILHDSVFPFHLLG